MANIFAKEHLASVWPNHFAYRRWVMCLLPVALLGAAFWAYMTLRYDYLVDTVMERDLFEHWSAVIHTYDQPAAGRSRLSLLTGPGYVCGVVRARNHHGFFSYAERRFIIDRWMRTAVYESDQMLDAPRYSRDPLTEARRLARFHASWTTACIERVMSRAELKAGFDWPAP